MSELQIAVNCESMLISTAFLRFCKAVEQFYYVMLLAAPPYDAQGAQPWESWLAMGFHIAARQAPRAVLDSDRIVIDALPGKKFQVKVKGSNRAALEKLRDLVTAVDRTRKSLTASDDAARLVQIRADREVGALLLTPLRDSLTRNAVADKQGFMMMIDRGLLAMCDRQIASIAPGLA